MVQDQQQQWYRVTNNLDGGDLGEVLQLTDRDVEVRKKYHYTVEPVVVMTVLEFNRALDQAYLSGVIETENAYDLK
jgi:hypothetical protein